MNDDVLRAKILRAYDGRVDSAMLNVHLNDLHGRPDSYVNEYLRLVAEFVAYLREDDSPHLRISPNLSRFWNLHLKHAATGSDR